MIRNWAGFGNRFLTDGDLEGSDFRILWAGYELGVFRKSGLKVKIYV